MNNALATFNSEIYRFLRSVSIMNPYVVSHVADKILHETGVTISLLENPYIVNMCGDMYHSYNNKLSKYNDDIILIKNVVDKDSELIYDRKTVHALRYNKTLAWFKTNPTLLQDLVKKYPERADYLKSVVYPVTVPESFAPEMDISEIYTTAHEIGSSKNESTDPAQDTNFDSMQKDDNLLVGLSSSHESVIHLDQPYLIRSVVIDELIGSGITIKGYDHRDNLVSSSSPNSTEQEVDGVDKTTILMNKIIVNYSGAEVTTTGISDGNIVKLVITTDSAVEFDVLRFSSILLDPTFYEKEAQIIMPVGSGDSAVEYLHTLRYGRDVAFVALKMTDFQVVSWGTGILESQEESDIVEAVVKFVEIFISRWHVQMLLQHEKYAPTIFTSMLWSILPSVIVKQRFGNINTIYAHSYLIWEYLESEGLSDYKDILNASQTNFLYRNIRYLKNIRGTAEGVAILATDLLPKGMRLSAKHLAITSGSMLGTCEPTPVVISKNILEDQRFLADATYTQENWKTIYNQEFLAGLEPGYGEDLEDDQRHTISRSYASTLPTKLLELEDNVDIDRTEMDYIFFLIETFLYRCGNDIDSSDINYDVVINMNNNTEVLEISAQKAMLLFFYCLYQETASTIVLTEKNEKGLTGKLVIIDGRRVLLDNTNITRYYNIPLTVVGPLAMPVKFSVSRVYASNKYQELCDNDVGSGGLETELLYKSHAGITHNINTTDAHHGALTRESQLERVKPVVLQANSSLTLYSDDTSDSTIDKLFEYRLSDILVSARTSDIREMIAFDKLYQQISTVGAMSVDLDSSGSGSYEEWLGSDDRLMELIIKLDISKTRSFVYGELASNILSAVFNLDKSTVFSGELSETQRRYLLQSLFSELTSYDIAFISSGDSYENAPIMSTRTMDQSSGFTAKSHVSVASPSTIIFKDPDYTVDLSIPNPPPVYRDWETPTITEILTYGEIVIDIAESDPNFSWTIIDGYFEKLFVVPDIPESHARGIVGIHTEKLTLTSPVVRLAHCDPGIKPNEFLLEKNIIIRYGYDMAATETMSIIRNVYVRDGSDLEETEQISLNRVVISKHGSDGNYEQSVFLNRVIISRQGLDLESSDETSLTRNIIPQPDIDFDVSDTISLLRLVCVKSTDGIEHNELLKIQREISFRSGSDFNFSAGREQCCDTDLLLSSEVSVKNGYDLGEEMSLHMFSDVGRSPTIILTPNDEISLSSSIDTTTNIVIRSDYNEIFLRISKISGGNIVPAVDVTYSGNYTMVNYVQSDRTTVNDVVVNTNPETIAANFDNNATTIGCDINDDVVFGIKAVCTGKDIITLCPFDGWHPHREIVVEPLPPPPPPAPWRQGGAGSCPWCDIPRHWICPQCDGAVDNNCTKCHTVQDSVCPGCEVPAHPLYVPW